MLSVKAQRERSHKDGVETVISERPTGVQSAAVPWQDPEHRQARGQLRQWCADPEDPGVRPRQARKISIGSGNSGRKQINA